MKQSYRWRCFACDKPNEPAAASCGSCGFPARASGAEIARARAARGFGASHAQRADGPPAESLRDSLARWSRWRKALAIIGAALLAIGALAWDDSFFWSSFMVSLFAFMFGGILLLVACVATERTEEARGGADG